MEPDPVRAGDTVELPEGLAAGEYRNSTTVEWMDTGDRDAVWSATFEVRS